MLMVVVSSWIVMYEVFLLASLASSTIVPNDAVGEQKPANEFNSRAPR